MIHQNWGGVIDKSHKENYTLWKIGSLFPLHRGETMEDRQNHSLYDPRFEHDACGIGAVVDLKGKPSHQTVSDALSIVEKLRHRAGRDAAGETGDGVGILLQVRMR